MAWKCRNWDMVFIRWNLIQPYPPQIGEKYGKTAAQVALHWLLQSDVIIIPKTVHKERMQENLNICIKIIRMENYGRKIIDYIFGKRSNSSAVSYEREQKIQADSDRSDIRVFETGISPQRHGNFRQSSRAAEEEECNRLISIAKENNLYYSGSMGLSL